RCRREVRILLGVLAGHVRQIGHRTALDVVGEIGELLRDALAVAELRHPMVEIELDRALDQRLGPLDTSRNGVEPRRLGPLVGLGFGSTPSRRKEFRSPVPLAVNDTVEREAPALLLLVEVDRHATLYASTSSSAQRV